MTSQSIRPLFGSWSAVHRALRAHERTLNTAIERLATGRRINHASDDPAGSVAVDALRARREEITASIDATGRELASLGAKEGGLSVISDLLIELDGLVVLAANGAALSGEERRAAQVQADSVLETIDRVAQTSTFNGEQNLTAYFTTKLGGPTPIDGLRSGKAQNLLDGDIEAAQRAVKSAISGAASTRAAIGTRVREKELATRTLQKELEGTISTISLIQDADIAQEASAVARARMLEQAALHTAQIAHQNARAVLELIDSAADDAPIARRAA